MRTKFARGQASEPSGFEEGFCSRATALAPQFTQTIAIYPTNLRGLPSGGQLQDSKDLSLGELAGNVNARVALT
jgi:hypothetical protein